jgi:hypothetical protein
LSLYFIPIRPLDRPNGKNRLVKPLAKTERSNPGHNSLLFSKKRRYCDHIASSKKRPLDRPSGKNRLVKPLAKTERSNPGHNGY